MLYFRSRALACGEGNIDMQSKIWLLKSRLFAGQIKVWNVTVGNGHDSSSILINAKNVHIYHNLWQSSKLTNKYIYYS